MTEVGMGCRWRMGKELCRLYTRILAERGENMMDGLNCPLLLASDDQAARRKSAGVIITIHRRLPGARDLEHECRKLTFGVN